MITKTIVQDGLKFYLETRNIDITTYKIDRVDISRYYENAYRDRAIKNAKRKQIKTRWQKALEQFGVAIKEFNQQAVRLAKSSSDALLPIAKIRRFPDETTTDR